MLCEKRILFGAPARAVVKHYSVFTAARAGALNFIVLRLLAFA